MSGTYLTIELSFTIDEILHHWNLNLTDDNGIELTLTGLGGGGGFSSGSLTTGRTTGCSSVSTVCCGCGCCFCCWSCCCCVGTKELGTVAGWEFCCCCCCICISCCCGCCCGCCCSISVCCWWAERDRRDSRATSSFVAVPDALPNTTKLHNAAIPSYTTPRHQAPVRDDYVDYILH